jgi:hypothetical protein
VRYAYAPLALHPVPAAMLAGEGTTLVIELAPDAAARAKDVQVHYPAGLVAVSPLVRVPSEGRAFQEIVARTSGVFDVVVEIPGLARETKTVAAGDAEPRTLQPGRGHGWIDALLWPAEPAFASDSPFRSLAITYPERDLGWLPGGPGGIVVIFLVASMLFGVLAIKPLKVTI